MTVFVLTPVFEEIENREDLAVGILFQVAINGDVAPVANFFGEVCGVKNKLRLEERVLLVRCEEAEIVDPEITHGFVQKSGMTGFIPCHVSKTFSEQGIFLLDVTTELLVKEKALKLRRAALLQKLDEDLAGFRVELVSGTFQPSLRTK